VQWNQKAKTNWAKTAHHTHLHTFILCWYTQNTLCGYKLRSGPTKCQTPSKTQTDRQADNWTDARNRIWCIFALNATSGGNNFNDFLIINSPNVVFLLVDPGLLTPQNSMKHHDSSTHRMDAPDIHNGKKRRVYLSVCLCLRWNLTLKASAHRDWRQQSHPAPYRSPKTANNEIPVPTGVPDSPATNSQSPALPRPLLPKDVTHEP